MSDSEATMEEGRSRVGRERRRAERSGAEAAIPLVTLSNMEEGFDSPSLAHNNQPNDDDKSHKSDEGEDRVSTQYLTTGVYETIACGEKQHGDITKGVTFSRSQSLPHLDQGRPRHRGLHRNFRAFSGRSRRYSEATLSRMRNLSTTTFSAVDARDENQERGNWDNPIEFFLSCLGYAVGLGNVWRFPYLCYQSGGGAFLIPYCIMLFFCGMPLMLMELTLGQYSSQGPLTVWKLSPIFKGIGIGQVICSCLVAIYYNMITGWSLYYLVVSVREVLPWSCCSGHWSTPNCVSFLSNTSLCRDMAGIGENETMSFPNATDLWGNGSLAKFAADEYFHNHFLGITDGISDLGAPLWQLVATLGFAWFIVFAVLLKGIKSFGKAVYFTSTFPYLVLTILLVRGVMEPGAMQGIKFYLTPQWERLADAKVWSDAASQIFYSTGVCFGGAITLASYNTFHNDLYKNAIIVAFMNSATSIFSGFVVFSILGFMAHSQNTTVDKVVTGGPGLTFIAYPQAVTLLPMSPLWSVMFFVMIVTLALSTMFPTAENIATAVIDQFPDQLRNYKLWVMMFTCSVLFLLGLPLTTGGGMYVLQLMDTYAVGYALLVLGLIEVTVISWRYGAGRLLNNIATMIGYKPIVLWKYVWVAVTPSLLIFAIVFTVLEYKPLEYSSYTYPDWSTYLGLSLTSISLLPIPLYALKVLVSYMRDHPGVGLLEALKTLSAPDPDWGPALAKHRFADSEHGEDDVFS